MIQNLNLILLTANEVADMRHRLKNILIDNYNKSNADLVKSPPEKKKEKSKKEKEKSKDNNKEATKSESEEPKKIQDQEPKDVKELFTTLYKSWCHNPGATFR
jgi:hypothetical protein